LFLLAYAFSGIAALIYEVAWTRLAVLQIGHSVAATSTVVSAFMGGLAVGSGLGGRLARRLPPTAALRIYALLEVAIAAFALLLPFALRSLQPLLIALYRDGESTVVFPLFRVAAGVFLLSIPAAAMGATFPIASRWFIRDVKGAARGAGALYSANTVGAACGALVAGFVLLPALGLRSTVWTAVALNLVAASVAWLIAARRPNDTPESAAAAPAGKRPSARSRPGKTATTEPASLSIAAFAFGLSGFAALALQMVWTRLLASIVGPTTYAFSVVVAVFIGGLAAGSALAVRFAPRMKQPISALVWCLLSSVMLALAAAGLVDRALLVMAEIAARDLAFANVLVRQVFIVTALVFPMAVSFGAAFPLAVSAGARSDGSVAADVGAIYAANTAGAITGALLAAFVLIPRFGLYGTMRALTFITAIGAMVLLFASRSANRSRAIGVTACILVVVIAYSARGWDKALLSSGAYKYASTTQGFDLRTSLTAGRLLYYREGATATVALREAVGSKSLSIDGKVDASNGGDMLTQRLLAHLPLLLHPEPRQIAIIGLGSGVTLGSALTHPIVRADTIEISPEVVEASRWFEVENHRALADPRTKLIIADARSHLTLTRMRYDVIISEPSNPWMAGVASLFTREFFQAARERLTPGGLFCQWAHTYDIGEADLRSIVATFLSVFPHAAMWLVGDADVLLVGSMNPLDMRIAGIADRWKRPGVDGDLRSVGVLQPFSLLSLFAAQDRDLARLAASAPIQTDDLAQLEYSGPRGVFTNTVNRNVELLRDVSRTAEMPAVVGAAVKNAGPDAWRDRGWMFLAAEAYDAAWRDFTRAVELDPADVVSHSGLIRAAAATNRSRLSETRAQLERFAAERSSVEAAVALSRLLAVQGSIDEAFGVAVEAARRQPRNLRVLEQLASVAADAGDSEQLQSVVGRLREVAPASEVTRYYAASLAFMQNKPSLTVSELEPVVRENPNHALAQNLMGAALASLGDRERARQAFDASLRADPLGAGTYTNLATLELESGNLDAAAQRYAEALTLDPSSETARRGLARAAGVADLKVGTTRRRARR
jgi:spermidine synthase